MFEVANQPPPLEPYNLFASDAVLREAVEREGAGWAERSSARSAATLGEPETIALGFAANRNPPVLKSFDRYGHRLDEVEFHPAWHALLAIALRGRAAFAAPGRSRKPGAHVARAAGTYMLAQIESGVYCPIAMTYGSVPTLRQAPRGRGGMAAAHVRAPLRPAFPPGAREDRGADRHGHDREPGRLGSAHQRDARRARGRRQRSACYGHKWFMSAPMCDAFLVLAQSPKGLDLLPDAALDAGRRAQRHAHQPAEGQARQQVERLERSGIRRRLRAADRRGGARHPDHHRDGQLHAARLRHRLVRR